MEQTAAPSESFPPSITSDPAKTGVNTVSAESGPSLDEISAVARAQDGDLAAFESLVDRYQAPIFRLAMRMVRDRSQAEDIVQDTFIAAWRKLPTLVEPAAFTGWLYQVATRRSLDVLRRKRPQETFDEEYRATEGVGDQPDPATSAVRRAEIDDFRRALDALSDDLRTCWVLKELDGLSYAEIGSALGLQPSTVRGRIARARRQLAERMQPWR